MIGATAPLILVPSHVNSLGPYNLLLDSGATRRLISPDLAANLGIESETEDKAFRAGGAVERSLSRVHSLAVGSAEEENAQVVIARDLEQIGAAGRQ
jgi:Aspartyl protease